VKREAIISIQWNINKGIELVMREFVDNQLESVVKVFVVVAAKADPVISAAWYGLMGNECRDVVRPGKVDDVLEDISFASEKWNHFGNEVLTNIKNPDLGHR